MRRRRTFGVASSSGFSGVHTFFDKSVRVSRAVSTDDRAACSSWLRTDTLQSFAAFNKSRTDESIGAAGPTSLHPSVPLLSRMNAPYRRPALSRRESSYETNSMRTSSSPS